MKKISGFFVTGISIFLAACSSPFTYHTADQEAQKTLTAIYSYLKEKNSQVIPADRIWNRLDAIKLNPKVSSKYKCLASEYQFYLTWQKKNFQLAQRAAEDVQKLCSTDFLLNYPKLQKALNVLVAKTPPAVCTFYNLSPDIKIKCKDWAKREVVKACTPNPSPNCKCFQKSSIREVASCYLKETYNPPLVSPLTF